MINKLHEEWEKVSEEARAAAEQDPSRRQEILSRMGALTDAFRKLTKSSVTRTTLSQAVRDALKEILMKEPLPEIAALQEEIGELRKLMETMLQSTGGSPEVADQLERVAADQLKTSEEITATINGQTAKIEEQATRLAALSQDLTSADDHLAEGLKDLEHRLTERLSNLESASASRVEALDGSLRQSMAAAETRLAEAQDQLEARISSEVQAISSKTQGELAERIAKIEAALPELRAMEERLKTEMDKAMDQLAEKMNTLVDSVNQIQSDLPPRQIFDDLASRLERTETRFRTISDHLDNLDSALVELKSMGERLGTLREEVSGLAGSVNSSEKDFRDTWELLGRRIQDMQDLLRTSVERWNADRANLRQRLVDLRDTLRDQLKIAVQSADGASHSVWGKLLMKPEGGLRMGADDWERLRTRLETILQGLESLLTDSN